MYKQYNILFNLVTTTYLVEENAQAALERLGKKARYSESEIREPFVTYPHGSEYRRLNTDGLVHVGEVIVDHIKNTRHSAYALPENEAIAKELIAQINKQQSKDQNGFYNRNIWA